MDAPANPENDTPDQTPPDASAANPSPVPAPAEAAPAPQPGAENALTPRQQLEQAARQVDQVAKAAPDSPLHYAALARYFGIPPQAVAAFPEEVKLRYAQERFDALVQGLDGKNLSPYLGDLDANSGKGMPVGKNPLAAAQDVRDDSQDFGPTAPDDAQAKRQHEDTQPYWLMGKGPLDLGGKDEPAAGLAPVPSHAETEKEGQSPHSTFSFTSPSTIVANNGETLRDIAARTHIGIERLMYVNGIKDPAARIRSGTEIKPPQQSPYEKLRDWFDDVTHPTKAMDIEAANNQLMKQALGDYSGQCAHYVFAAIAAGKHVKLDDIEHPHYAKDSGPYLEKLGFRKLTDTLDGYVPKKGDVVVIQDYPGQQDKQKKPLPAGHIAMFNGEYWVSDTVQRGYSGMWSNLKFRDKAKGPLAIYRP